MSYGSVIDGWGFHHVARPVTVESLGNIHFANIGIMYMMYMYFIDSTILAWG